MHAYSSYAANPNNFRKWSHSGTFEVCGMYNKGKCTEVKADGPAGPNTCSKHETRIHACDSRGTPGHTGAQCPEPVSCSARIQKSGKGQSKAHPWAQGGKGKGKGKKGKKGW